MSAQNRTASSGNCYIQMSDLQMGKYEWYPIGANGFAGEYNGNGYTIYSLYVNNSSLQYVGMFSKVSLDYTKPYKIENLTIKDSYFKSTRSSSYVGSIAGYINASPSYRMDTVQNSYSNATVIGSYCAGGLVGLGNQYSGISNCTFAGDVNCTGSQGVGGILGESTGFPGGQVTGCKMFGKVEGGGYLGGIIGRLGARGTGVSSCIVAGTIQSNTSNAGGIAAVSSGAAGSYGSCPISNCQVIATVITSYPSAFQLFVYSASVAVNVSNCSFYGSGVGEMRQIPGGFYNIQNSYTDFNGAKTRYGADWSGWAVVPNINGGRPIQKALYTIADGADSADVTQWFTDNGF